MPVFIASQNAQSYPVKSLPGLLIPFGAPHLHSSHLWENLCVYKEDILTKIFTGWMVCSTTCKMLSTEFRKKKRSYATAGCFFFNLKDVSGSAKICPNAS